MKLIIKNAQFNCDEQKENNRHDMIFATYVVEQNLSCLKAFLPVISGHLF